MHTLPKTLRQIAGLPEKPAPLRESAVLVIDAQKEYTDGALPLHDIATSVQALAAFLARARAEGVPVIHIVQIGPPGGPIMDPQGPYVDIIDPLKPVPGETVVEKRFPSSFTHTRLDDVLEATGRKDLIITGYMTHMCLNSTTRDAAERGYRCVIAAGLTATRDLPDGKGGVIPAETVKTVNLASLADRFAIVLDTAQEIA